MKLNIPSYTFSLNEINVCSFALLPDLSGHAIYFPILPSSLQIALIILNAYVAQGFFLDEDSGWKAVNGAIKRLVWLER